MQRVPSLSRLAASRGGSAHGGGTALAALGAEAPPARSALLQGGSGRGGVVALAALQQVPNVASRAAEQAFAVSSGRTVSFGAAGTTPSAAPKAAAAPAAFRCAHGATRSATGCFVCNQCFSYPLG